MLRTIYLTEELFESLAETVSDDDVEQYDVKHSLNERIWQNGHLRSKVRMRLLDIADDFFDTLGISEDDRVDTILTGSMCNYNWTSSSDIDLHIVVDFSNICDDTETLKDYFDMKKNEWNKEHERLKIYNFPIEVYIQDVNEKHISHGIYSLESDKWLVKPMLKSFSDTVFDKNDIVAKANYIMDIIDDLDNASQHEKDKHKLSVLRNKITSLFKRLKTKRQDSLNGYGEMGSWNIVWKILRNNGYIERLVALKAILYDKINSLQ